MFQGCILQQQNIKSSEGPLHLIMAVVTQAAKRAVQWWLEKQQSNTQEYVNTPPPRTLMPEVAVLMGMATSMRGALPGRLLWMFKWLDRWSQSTPRGKVQQKGTSFLFQTLPLLERPQATRQRYLLGWALHESPEVALRLVLMACVIAVHENLLLPYYNHASSPCDGGGGGI